MGDRNNSGFGLKQVGVEMPGEPPGGALRKAVECLCLELEGNVRMITGLAVDFVDRLTVLNGFTGERT